MQISLFRSWALTLAASQLVGNAVVERAFAVAQMLRTNVWKAWMLLVHFSGQTDQTDQWLSYRLGFNDHIDCEPIVTALPKSVNTLLLAGISCDKFGLTSSSTFPSSLHTFCLDPHEFEPSDSILRILRALPPTLYTRQTSG